MSVWPKNGIYVKLKYKTHCGTNHWTDAKTTHLRIPGNSIANLSPGFYLQKDLFCLEIKSLLFLKSISCCKYRQRLSETDTMKSNNIKTWNITPKRYTVSELRHNQITHTSSNRFCFSSSNSNWSNSDMAVTNIIAVTSWKQWIHFRRSLRCPPTSRNLNTHICMICDSVACARMRFLDNIDGC